MKRSEMVDRIHTSLCKFDTNENSLLEMASTVLDVVEAAGMLPASFCFNDDTHIPILEALNCLDVTDLGKPEWEPEE